MDEETTMDEETKAAFDGVLQAILGIEESLAGLATKAQLDALMQRMNDGFERVLLTQRVTRLEQDVRQLRGGI